MQAEQLQGEQQVSLEVAKTTEPKIVAVETEIVNSVALVSATQGYIEPEPDVRRIVTRETTVRGGGWSVQLGAYSSRYKAEKVLLRTALADLRALEGALRKIAPTKSDGRTLYRARFVGLSATSAQRACARLKARNEPCTPVAPGA